MWGSTHEHSTVPVYSYARTCVRWRMTREMKAHAFTVAHGHARTCEYACTAASRRKRTHSAARLGGVSMRVYTLTADLIPSLMILHNGHIQRMLACSSVSTAEPRLAEHLSERMRVNVCACGHMCALASTYGANVNWSPYTNVGTGRVRTRTYAGERAHMAAHGSERTRVRRHKHAYASYCRVCTRLRANPSVSSCVRSRKGVGVRTYGGAYTGTRSTSTSVHAPRRLHA